MPGSSAVPRPARCLRVECRDDHPGSRRRRILPAIRSRDCAWARLVRCARRDGPRRPGPTRKGWDGGHRPGARTALGRCQVESTGDGLIGGPVVDGVRRRPSVGRGRRWVVRADSARHAGAVAGGPDSTVVGRCGRRGGARLTQPSSPWVSRSSSGRTFSSQDSRFHSSTRSIAPRTRTSPSRPAYSRSRSRDRHPSLSVDLQLVGGRRPQPHQVPVAPPRGRPLLHRLHLQLELVRRPQRQAAVLVLGQVARRARSGPRNFDGRMTLPLSSSECSYLPKNRATGDCSHDAPRSARDPTVQVPPFHTTLRHSTPHSPTRQPLGSKCAPTATRPEPRSAVRRAGDTAAADRQHADGPRTARCGTDGGTDGTATGPAAGTSGRWDGSGANGRTGNGRRGSRPRSAQGSESSNAAVTAAPTGGAAPIRAAQVGHPGHDGRELGRGASPFGRSQGQQRRPGARVPPQHDRRCGTTHRRRVRRWARPTTLRPSAVDHLSRPRPRRSRPAPTIGCRPRSPARCATGPGQPERGRGPSTQVSPSQSKARPTSSSPQRIAGREPDVDPHRVARGRPAPPLRRTACGPPTPRPLRPRTGSDHRLGLGRAEDDATDPVDPADRHGPPTRVPRPPRARRRAALAGIAAPAPPPARPSGPTPSTGSGRAESGGQARQLLAGTADAPR